jgi:hypothetical protein
MKRCKGIFGTHKFEARFDRHPVEMRLDSVETHGREGLDALEALTVQKIYVRDICIRCGQTIERNS